MHLLSIAKVLVNLLVITGVSMLFPLIVSLYYGEGGLFSTLASMAITIGLGLPLSWLFRKNDELNIRDGFIIAVAGWILVSAFSALPFVIQGSIPSFTDAFFEMMSGYTTTGATILTMKNGPSRLKCFSK
jgi:trk system potassium uptake protein